jgi:hypothetical protein
MNDTLKKPEPIFRSVENPKNVYIFGNPNRAVFEGTKYTIVNRVEGAHFVYISTPQLTEEQYNSYLLREQLRESGASFFGTNDRRWDSLVVDPFIPELKIFIKNNLPIVVGNPDLVSKEYTKGSSESN